MILKLLFLFFHDAKIIFIVFIICAKLANKSKIFKLSNRYPTWSQPNPSTKLSYKNVSKQSRSYRNRSNIRKKQTSSRKNWSICSPNKSSTIKMNVRSMKSRNRKGRLRSIPWFENIRVRKFWWMSWKRQIRCWKKKLIGWESKLRRGSLCFKLNSNKWTEWRSRKCCWRSNGIVW